MPTYDKIQEQEIRNSSQRNVKYVAISVCCMFESDEYRNERYFFGAVTSSLSHDCIGTNQGELVEHPKWWITCYWWVCSCSAHAVPDRAFPRLLKQTCHSKAAIKLTSCSLSDPLIKGRYPVYGLALGSGVSLATAMHHPDTGGVVTLARQDGGSTNPAEPLWRAPALPCVVSAVPPSLTNQKTVTYHQPEDGSRQLILKDRSDGGLSESRRGFYRTGRWLFRRCVGAVVGSGSGPGDLAYRKVTPSPEKKILLIFSSVLMLFLVFSFYYRLL